MILGLTLSEFTLIHVVISLVAILTGLMVVGTMLRGTRAPLLTGIFLSTTVVTSLTGFLFHASFGPPHVIGLISLVVLTIAITARYLKHLRGPWRWIYVTAAVTSVYLNAFIGVVQTFQKVRFFHSLAPTQAEPPFAIAQGIVLVLFIALGILAAKRFRAPYASLSVTG